MEENDINMAPPVVEAKTKSPPTQVVATTMEEMVTVVAMDENPSLNGGVARGEGEDNDVGIDKESGGADAKVTVRRKRGRPRKHKRDENSTTLISASFSASLTQPAQKRGRGRPRGTSKLQMMASFGGFSVDTTGRNFTPHVMAIQIGEDVAEKIFSFAERGPHAICVLSANGPVSIVDICPAGSVDGIIRYEGHFELLKLSGSYDYSKIGVAGVQRKIGVLNIALVNSNGRVFGGVVAGSLIAAGPIQLILASFHQSTKKQLPMTAESSTAACIKVESDTVRVLTSVDKTIDVDENCVLSWEHDE